MFKLKRRTALALSLALMLCAALSLMPTPASALAAKAPQSRVNVSGTDYYAVAYNATLARYEVTFASLADAQAFSEDPQYEGLGIPVSITAPEGEYAAFEGSISCDSRPLGGSVTNGSVSLGVWCFSGGSLLAGSTVTIAITWIGTPNVTETVELYIAPVAGLTPVPAARLSVVSETLCGLAGADDITITDGQITVTLPDGDAQAWGDAYMLNPDGNEFNLSVRVAKPDTAASMAVGGGIGRLNDYSDSARTRVYARTYADVNTGGDSAIVVMREGSSVFFVGLKDAQDTVTYETFTVTVAHNDASRSVELDPIAVPGADRVTMNTFLSDTPVHSLTEGSVTTSYSGGVAGFEFADADTLLANPDYTRLGISIAPPEGFTPGSDGFAVSVNGIAEAVHGGLLYITQPYRDNGALITNSHSDICKIIWTQGQNTHSEAITFSVTCLAPFDTWMEENWDPIPASRITLYPGYDNTGITATVTNGHIEYTFDSVNMPALDTLISEESLVMITPPAGAVYFRWSGTSSIEYDAQLAQDTFDRLVTGNYPTGGEEAGNANGDRFDRVFFTHGDGKMHLSNAPTLGRLVTLDGLKVCLSNNESVGTVLEWYDSEFNRIGERGEYISWTVNPFLYRSVTPCVSEVTEPVDEPTLVSDDAELELVCKWFPQQSEGNELYVQLETENGSIESASEVYLPYSLFEAGLTYELAVARGLAFTIRHYNSDHSTYTTLTGELTPNGVKFVTGSFSPFVISWTNGAPAPGGLDGDGVTRGIFSGNTVNAPEVTPPSTGGEARPFIVTALVLTALALAALCVARRRDS